MVKLAMALCFWQRRFYPTYYYIFISSCFSWLYRTLTLVLQA